MSRWITELIEGLKEVRLPNVFNPYIDHCPSHDVEDAPQIRSRNLEAVLDSAGAAGIDSIWFGRELGWRGGRRTGVALTDESHLQAACVAFGTKDIRRATRGQIMGERTATVVWDVIARLPRPPMLWNAFPFHAHETADDFSNRAHSAQEREITAWVIERMVKELQPRHLVAIGNDAARALDQLGLEFNHVRHPSYGGQREFLASMETLHGLGRDDGDLFRSQLAAATG